ncbi:MAG: SPASM domain-containing protein [Deltaproteobacteria bacterium]|nr:SPASM domain-containing protein [Deltaproteobacteria bacterium]
MNLLRRQYRMRELLLFRSRFFRLAMNWRRVVNFLKVKISWWLRLERVRGLPIHLHVEPSGSCDQLCLKCQRFAAIFRDDGRIDGNKLLPFETYQSVIDEIGESLLTVRLWHYGAPLQNPDIFRMIEYAKARHLIVAVSSTLSLLNAEKAERLVRSGLDYLIVSLDGATPESYRRNHGVDHFERVLGNLTNLLEVRRRLHTPFPMIDLQFIVMKDNEHEIPHIRELAARLGVDRLSIQRVDISHLDELRDGRRGIGDAILPINPEFRLDMSDVLRDRACRLPWEEALVRYSGLVLPCVSDLRQEWPMGRVGANGSGGIRDAWNGESFRQLRRRIRADIDAIPMCSTCSVRNNHNEDIHDSHNEDIHDV